MRARAASAAAGLMLVLGIFPGEARADHAFFWEPVGIPVEESGETPFFGGLGAGANLIPSVRFRLSDLDRDRDLDLYILDDDGRIQTFENLGTATAPRFRAVDDDLLGIELKDFFLFVDLDGDSLTDIVGGRIAGGEYIEFFKNVGGPASPIFERRSPAPYLDSLQVIPREFSNVPAFGDLDKDGDLDCFYMEPTTGYGAYHENIGNRTQPRFGSQVLNYGNFNTFITPSLRGAQEVAPLGAISADAEALHGVSVPSLFDFDGDDDLDLFIGDVNLRNLWQVRSDGTPDSAAFTIVSNDYLTVPGAAQSLFLWGSEFGDLNGDGKADLVVSPEDPLAGLPRPLYLYRNAGAGAVASFEYAGDSLVTGIDVGKRCLPAFGDLDGDGDSDMILSHATSQAGEGMPGVQGLTYFENIGSPAEPAFRPLLDPDPLSAVVHRELDSPAPVLADMDEDGDLDLLVGQGSIPRQVYYYENQGSASEHAFVFTGVLLDANLRRRPDNSATVALGDLDRDGDLDMLLGEYGSSGRAKLYYYRNVGTFSQMAAGRQPVFEWVVTKADTLFGFDTVADSAFQELAPLLRDSNCDGYLDIWLGSTDGRLREYRSRGEGDSLRFDIVSRDFDNTDVGMSSAPAFVDIDADGDLDLFVGERNGGVNFFRNRSGELTAGAADSAIVVSWRAVGGTGGTFRLERSEGNGAFLTIAEIPQAEGHEPVTYRDEGAGFAGNLYRYRLETERVAFACGSFGPVEVAVPFPDVALVESSVSIEEGGAMVRWRVSATFRGLAFRLFRRDPGGGLEVVAGADSLPGAIENAFLDPAGLSGSSYRLEALYRKAGVLEAAPDSVFAPVDLAPLYALRLYAPRPNPTGGTAEFVFDLPPDVTAVSVRVVDVSGRLVREIRAAGLAPGAGRSLTWDGADGSGDAVAAGVYFYQITAGPQTKSGRLILVR